MKTAFTLWTRPVLPRLERVAIHHLTFNRDLFDCGKWVLSYGTDANAILMRPFGHHVAQTYIPNATGELPPLPSFA